MEELIFEKGRIFFKFIATLILKEKIKPKLDIHLYYTQSNPNLRKTHNIRLLIIKYYKLEYLRLL